MTVSWSELPLELEGAEQFPFYDDVVADFCPKPIILNPWLTGERSLIRSRKEGLIIARGQGPVPREYAEPPWIDIELSLRDENNDELQFVFRGRLNHWLKTLDERRLRKQFPHPQPRVPIFSRDGVGGASLRSELLRKDDQSTTDPTTET